jgi:protocatechuate 3,4-dioxygenase beta subunit
VFGHAFISRLVTQMYFPGDPLFAFDLIFNSVPGEHQSGLGAVLLLRYCPAWP